MTERGMLDQALRVYRELCEAAPGDERAWLDERCRGNPELHAAVSRLIDEDNDEAGLDAAADEMLGLAPAGELPEIEIEGVRLLGLLGRGASGDVYEAQQRSPERRVAVKLLRSAATSALARSRFEQEARVLASLSHPTIATVHRTGSARTASGAEVPFILMELVEGHTVADAARTMPVDQRIRLLATIARGIHAAHQAGIIHRDLKPANIVVDQSGRPRVLDFGVARLLDDTAAAVHTTTGEMLGTLGYMSPEQIEGTNGPIGTATDVYSIGVLMYELLAGEPAVPQRDRSPIETATSIVRGQLPKLETAALALPQDAEAVYRKATDTDAERRYDSAAAFADDLERLADGRPVSAKRPTAAYLFSRFARRNPALVGLVAAAGIAVGLLGTLATVGFVSASRERDAALEAGARLETSYQFLRSMLASADPGVDGPNVRVVDLLDRWAQTIGDESIGDPIVQTDLHRTVGWTYASLSLHDRAIEHYDLAAELAQKQQPADPVLLAGLKTDKANSLVHVGRSELAVELAGQSVQALFALDDAQADVRVAALVALGESQRVAGLPREGLETLQRAVDLGNAELEVGHEHTRAAMSGLGRASLELQLAADAADLYQDLVDLNTRTLGDDHPDTMLAAGNLGTALNYAGEYERSIRLFEGVTERMEDVLGPEHYDYRMFRGNMVDALYSVGREDEALELSRSVIDEERRIEGPAHQSTAVAMNNHAVLLLQLDRIDEAVRVTTELVPLMDQAFGADHPRSMLALRNYAQAQEKVGNTAEALKIQRELLARQQSMLGPTEYDTLVTHNNLGMLLRSLGQGEEAVTHLRTVVEHTGEESGYPAYLHAIFTRNLARCLLAAGRLDEADDVLARARALDADNAAHQEKCDEVAAAIQTARGGFG
ncbi:MAG: serine/threonine-protein kinase [Planctomycetota bacterium]